MKHLTNRPARASWIAIAFALLLVGLTTGPVAAQLNANPFTVVFDGVEYDINLGTSTWHYSVTWNPTSSNNSQLSHFGIQLCDTATVLSASPLSYVVGNDGSLANSDCQLEDFHSIKWDGNNGLVTPGQTVQFSFTLDKMYELGTILTASKASTNCNLNTVPGPSLVCEEIDIPTCSIDPSTQEVCEGGSADFTVNATGGVAPYTYSWTGPNGFSSDQQTITASDAGVYTAIVTDSIGQVSAGCTASLNVNDNPDPQPGSYEFCTGDSVELDAGAGFASYLWNDGYEGQTRTVSAEGTYTVTVTNESGCSASADHVVTENSLPEPVGSNAGICEDDDPHTFDAGAGFASYSWSGPNGEDLGSNQTITVSGAGTYTVTVTNDNGCSGSADHVLVVNDLPEPVGSNAEICEGDDPHTFDAGAGFASYSWSGPNGEDLGSNQTITVSGAGTYTVTVTNDNGCGGSADHVLVVNDLPEPVGSNAEICEGDDPHTFDAGAGFASYSWSGPNGEDLGSNQTIAVSGAGTYTVTVTNDNGCGGSADHVLVVNDLPEPVGSNAEICEGDDPHTFDAGAGFASYSWSGPNGEDLGSNQTIAVSGAGTYTVTVTNDNGCSGSADHVLVVNDLPEPVGSNAEICEGDDPHTFDAGAGFASYSWSGPNGEDLGSNQTITVSGAGTYTVTVTNDNGCSGSADHVLVVNDLPEPVGSNAEICEGDDPHTFDAGAGFASYSWSGPNGEDLGSNQTIAVSGAGTYTVTVTNDNGCSGSADHVLVVNDLPEPVGSNAEICEGDDPHTFDAGAGFASYSWSGPNGEDLGSNQTITVSGAGTYTVTVTNDNGCGGSADHVLVVNDLPEPVGSNAEICEGDDPHTFDAGAGFASYSWSGPGEFTSDQQTITVSGAGTYTVTVTNENDCGASADHVLVVNDLPEPVGSDAEICEGEEHTFDAGEGFASYSWSGPGEFTSDQQMITVSTAGTYTVTVTNENECSASAEHVLVVNDLPEPVGSDAEICDGEDHTFDAGEGFASYSWSGPDGYTADTRTITVSDAGTYTVTVTNDSECSASADHELVVKDLPEPQGSDFEICDGEDHTFDAGDGFSSYSWTGPGEFTADTQTVTVSAAGTYTVTVTGENGCSNDAYHELVVNDLPPADITVGEVCAGSTNNMASTPDAGLDATYEWSIGNGTITSETPYGATIAFTAGEDATTPVTLTVTVTSADGCVSSDEVEAMNKACTEGCSLTQGAWGSLGGAGTLAQVESLIGVGGMTVGYGGNTFNVELSDAPCLVQVLPAGGKPDSLSGVGIFQTGQPNCKTSPNYLHKKSGKLKNVFLGQMLTFTLNMRDSADLQNITLCATMTTQAVIHTADGDVLDPGPDGMLGTDDDPIITVTIPQSVLDALDANGLPRTTVGLLELGNMALGGVDVGTSISNVNKAVDAINIGFDECRIKIDCVPVSTLSDAALVLADAEVSIPLCRSTRTMDRAGFEDDFVIADSVIDGFGSLDLPADLKGLAQLAAMARLGQTSGVPIDDLNRVIDEVNLLVSEGRLIGGCDW